MLKNSITPRETLFKIIKEKHELLKQILKEKKMDCYLIFVRETAAMKDPVIDLLVGGDVVWESAFIFSIDKEGNYHKIAIIGNYDADTERDKGIWNEVIPYDTGISDVLKKEIGKLNPKEIAINFALENYMSDGITYGMFLKLEQYIPNLKFISANPIVSSLRGRKTTTELELIKKAAEITEDINNYMTTQMKHGMTEIEIQNQFHAKMDELEISESWQRSGCPASDAGPDKVMGHVGPSELKVKEGHTFHNDYGLRYFGYCSDLQRMWYFGNEKEIPNELKHAYETVHGAITRAFNFIKPGVKGWEVDKIARDYVVERGYKEYMHGLGHQVGREAHDGGVLLGPIWEKYGDAPKGEVEENNVFTLELGVYTKKYGGVSLEEMIQVTKNGAEWIVPRTEDWICIE
jgi:Xaa-Pro aminopeptidase